jgi:hypothetical protein
VVFPAKLSCGDDTRLLQLVPGVTYLELMEHVRQLYPALGPFVLKFVDKEGDLVTLSNRGDIQRAMQEAVEMAARTAGPRAQLTQQSLPHIRLQVVKVSSEVRRRLAGYMEGWGGGGTGGLLITQRYGEGVAGGSALQFSLPPGPATHCFLRLMYCSCTALVPQAEVPKIPDEEMAYVKQMLAQLQRAQDAQKATAQPAAEEEAQPPVQIDEWILQFVDLLKEHCGIDPDKPLECQEVGQDRLNSAFTAMMEQDPKAEQLLDQAMDKFEVSPTPGRPPWFWGFTFVPLLWPGFAVAWGPRSRASPCTLLVP